MPALMDHHQIARDLIELESITGNEAPVVAYLEKRLGELGLDVRSEEVAPCRRNLVAGPETPALIFCTHTDTVPPYVPLSEDEEFIYGRGACDTKGITACFLAAGERLLAEGLDDFGYLFVVGEEIDNVGAIAANRSVRCGHLVVGEPTENRIALGHKGALGARVRVEGRACHSAYPEEGDSAIHRLLGYLQRVLRTDFGNSELLGAATVNIGGIEGGAFGTAPAFEERADREAREHSGGFGGACGFAQDGVVEAYDGVGADDNRVFSLAARCEQVHDSTGFGARRFDRVVGGNRSRGYRFFFGAGDDFARQFELAHKIRAPGRARAEN